MSCPGSCTAQKGTRNSAVMRESSFLGRLIFQIKVFLPIQYIPLLKHKGLW